MGPREQRRESAEEPERTGKIDTPPKLSGKAFSLREQLNGLLIKQFVHLCLLLRFHSVALYLEARCEAQASQ